MIIIVIIITCSLLNTFQCIPLLVSKSVTTKYCASAGVLMVMCTVWVLLMKWHEVYKGGQLIYISSGLKTHLRFPTHLQPTVDWLVYQAEAVHAKTVCLGSNAKLVSTGGSHLSRIFWKHENLSGLRIIKLMQSYFHWFIWKSCLCKKSSLTRNPA